MQKDSTCLKMHAPTAWKILGTLSCFGGVAAGSHTLITSQTARTPAAASVLVQGGTFWMGSDNEGMKDARPWHEVKVDTFEGVQFVHITARTKGRGFAGVVKRWDFGGMPATHGSSDRERHPGSLGRQHSNPGDVIKNKKMAGRYGNEQVTTKNIELVKILKEKNVLLVHGAVPGPDGGYVLIQASPKIRKPPAVSKKKHEIVKKK
jgi:50S ribosomal protein uL3